MPAQNPTRAYGTPKASPQLTPCVALGLAEALEKNAGPEFMEIAIDYAEAMRNARDLVKLAKLTKQKVSVSKKEPGKPRVEVEVEYGAAEGSGLASTKEYAERAFQARHGSHGSAHRPGDGLAWPPGTSQSRGASGLPFCSAHVQEAIGASVALSAAVDLLPKPK